MIKAFKTGVTALLLGATLAGGIATTPAFADPPRGRGWDKDDHRGRGHDKHWDRDDRRGPDRVIVIRDRRPAPRVVYAYDYNRPDPRYRGYYADRYYRPYDRYGYDPIRVTRETRIYRGYDDRYYCRRSDGTTGLIVGAAVGALIGDRIDRGRSSILGAVLGAGAGGLIGRELERGDVVCR
ncbi:MAG: glycine zipper 2TM domain-containing protein [Sphingomonas sp.]|nr:glycine zipper 2TM domain-containing protein [Sphingomonas sp.]